MLYELTPIDVHVDVVDDDEHDRAGDRVNVPFPARVIVGDHEGQTPVTAHLVNLSEQGAALRVYGRLEPGDNARLLIEMGRAPVALCVRTVWTRNLPEGRLVGVTFERLTAVQEASIAKLLDDHRA